MQTTPALFFLNAKISRGKKLFCGKFFSYELDYSGVFFFQFSGVAEVAIIDMMI